MALTIRIERRRVFSQIAGPGGVVNVVRNLTRFRPRNYYWSRAYQEGRWDGWSYPVWKNGMFPAGLTDRIARSLRAAGHAVTIADLRKRPDPSLDLPPLRTELMPHQIEAIDAIENRAAGIIYHPVGSGKTLVIVGAVQRLRVPTIVVVHTRDLLYQHVERFREFLGVEPGIVGDGVWQPGDVTVAMIQTLYRDLYRTQERFSGVEAVFVDETQHVEAKSFREVMRRLPAYYRVGLSATPFRSGTDENVMLVESWLGPVIHDMPVAQGIETGRLVPATIWMCEMPPIGRSRGTFADAYERAIVRNEFRNRLIAGLAADLHRKGPVLILVRMIEHGHILRDMLYNMGVSALFLSGDSSASERAGALADLRTGALGVVIATVIFDEGVDAPAIKTLILAAAGVAPHRQIQRIGRGMRRAEGKTSVRVIDFLDDDGGYLRRHAEDRLKTYLSEPAYTVRIVSREEVSSYVASLVEQTHPAHPAVPTPSR